MPGHTHFDESTEEYLEAVYRLEREGPGVSTSGLASELGVAPASVSGMLKKLTSDGYLDHRARGDAKLTTKGLEVAVRVIRRHRLAERLLTDVLGMSWDRVHEEACRLEHAISEDVESRLIDLLGDPRVCPHGHPIPSLDLSDPIAVGIPLAQVDVGGAYVVYGVKDEISEVLRYLAEIDLVPGRDVVVRARAPLGGPLTIETSVDGRTKQHAISLELARMLVVVEDATPEAGDARSVGSGFVAAGIASAPRFPRLGALVPVTPVARPTTDAALQIAPGSGKAAQGRHLKRREPRGGESRTP